MSTTEVPVRSPRPSPADGATGPGGPRRRPGSRGGRIRRASVITAVLVLLPLILLAGIGMVVIDGYQGVRAALESRSEDPAPTAEGAAAAPEGPNDHAPIGPDVGTDGLDAQLLRAITRARDAAAADGITVDIVSGYRTAATQQRLYDEAIVKYGSAAEARRWVLPPEESGHVQGAAVDVGPYAAAQWLEKNGVKFGLCRRYENEYWHFEVLAPDLGQPCPALEADASG